MARYQFNFEGRSVASITLTLLRHDAPRTNPDACWALADAPFPAAAELARFCSSIFRNLDLLSSHVGLLVAIIESCFEFLLPHTVRHLLLGAGFVVFKIVNDQQLSIAAAAELLKVDVAKLGAAEAFVLAVLLQT